MAPASNGGLSEYELQRIKNVEENRRILESIRQEQVNKLILIGNNCVNNLVLRSSSTLLANFNRKKRNRKRPAVAVPTSNPPKKFLKLSYQKEKQMFLMLKMLRLAIGESLPGSVGRLIVNILLQSLKTPSLSF